jgi:anti-anti-sigma regulatory factor
MQAPNRLAIAAEGHLDAVTAHLLPKAVIGVLRRFPTAVLAIDITEVSSIDDIGELALADCRREAERRGIAFTVVDRTVHQPAPAEHRSIRPNTWMRPHRTGTTCTPAPWPR